MKRKLLFLLALLLAVGVGFALARRSGCASPGPKVGVVEVRGFIADPRAATEALRELREDDDVKAIVLRVDSPGGVVAPSQEIYDEVGRTAATKPVVVSMGTVAASGGYYLSAPATKIVANPGTATGSIGVILKFEEVHRLMDRLGLQSAVVKSGPMKDSGSPFRPMRPEEKAVFQGLVDDIFDQFVGAVAKGRRMDRAKVLALADGRIYSGRQAQKLGLVDQLGGFWDAVALAQKLGKLEGKPNLLYRGKKGGGVLRWLLGEDSDALAPLWPGAGSPLRYEATGW